MSDFGKGAWIRQGSEALFSRNMRKNTGSLVGGLIGFDYSLQGGRRNTDPKLMWGMSATSLDNRYQCLLRSRRGRRLLSTLSLLATHLCSRLCCRDRSDHCSFQVNCGTSAKAASARRACSTCPRSPAYPLQGMGAGCTSKKLYVERSPEGGCECQTHNYPEFRRKMVEGLASD